MEKRIPRNRNYFTADTDQELIDKAKSFFTIHGVPADVRLTKDEIIVSLDDSKWTMADEVFSKAKKSFYEGNYEESILLLLKVLDTFPSHSESFRMLASIYLDIDDLDKAEDICIEALRWEPNNINSLLLLSTIKRKKGDYTGARACNYHALEINDACMEARTNLAAILFSEEKYEEALEMFEKVIATGQAPIQSHVGRVTCLERLKRKEDAFHAALESAGMQPKTIYGSRAARRLEVAVLDLGNELMIKGLEHTKELVDAEIMRFNAESGYILREELLPETDKISYLRYDNDPKQSVFTLYIQEKDTYASYFKLLELSRLKTFLWSRESEGCDFKSLYDGRRNLVIDLLLFERIFAEYRDFRPLQLGFQAHIITQRRRFLESGKAKKLSRKELDSFRIMSLVMSLQMKYKYLQDYTIDFNPAEEELRKAEDLYDVVRRYAKNLTPGQEIDLIEFFDKEPSD